MRKKIPLEFTPENSRLVFIRQTVFKDYKRNISPKALYKCSCGNEVEVFINSAKAGTTVSCGCYNLEKLKERGTKHGYYNHPVYRIWAHVRSRCYNENCKEYFNYGGRGVEMCVEWKDDPKSMVEWCISNGWEKGLELDKDIKAKQMGVPPLLYSPDRCMFVTKSVNLSETRHNVWYTYNGVTKTVCQWAEHIGVVKNTLQNRLRRYGWTIERALTEPTNVNCRKNKAIK